jgi:hypothetical protein
MGFFGNESSIDDHKIQQINTRGGIAAGGSSGKSYQATKRTVFRKICLDAEKFTLREHSSASY